MATNLKKRRLWFGMIFLAGLALIGTDITGAIILRIYRDVIPFGAGVRVAGIIDRLMMPGIGLFLIGAVGFVANLDRPKNDR